MVDWRPVALEASHTRRSDRDALTTVELTCRLSPAMKRSGDYALIPFEVAPGTRRLELEYRYPGQGQPGSPNEIDLGLVDPRGADFPRFPGFRGWSGNARTGAVLTEAAATPGYLPGPIPGGRWWVLLGLYKLAPTGVDVQVCVRTGPRDVPPPPPEPVLAHPGSPRSGARRWVRGDLHSHTHHSDAAGSVRDLVESARHRSLDFLAVTDHNTTSHFPYLAADAGIALLAGEEVTTYYGHMNVWGNSAPLDFRARDAHDVEAIIDIAHEQGALVSASHPTLEGMNWTFGYEVPLDCLEVWHGNAGTAALAIWEGLLAGGRRITAVGGSDVHIGKPYSPPPGRPTTWLRLEALDGAGVLDALRAGRAAITAGPKPDGPWLELSATDGSTRWEVGDTADRLRVTVRARVKRGLGATLRLLSARGELSALPVDRDPFECELDLDLGEHRLVRAELRQDGELAALTNPIWTRIG